MNTSMNHKSKLNVLVLASIASLAAGSSVTFAAVQMETGYEVASIEAACGGDKSKTSDSDKSKEGKCGEGKCGAEKSTTTEKAKEGKCGEGKCGGDKKPSDEKAKEGKCGGAA